MVGIPKTNRCEFCKKRKIKCDEAWPTCGSCKTSGRKCSGPPQTRKFVHNGHHSRYGRDDRQTCSDDNASRQSVPGHAEQVLALVDVTQSATDYGTFLKMRIGHRTPTPPSVMPMSRVDMVITELVATYKMSAGTGFDIVMQLDCIRYIPQCIGSSQALCDATEVFLASWQNQRRGYPPDALMDRKAYVQALQSLQKALNDPVQCFSNTTLAANTILQRTEYIFDYSRGANQVSHAAGAYAILANRGPPKKGDRLGTTLAFDNFGTLVVWFIVTESPCMYNKSDWRDTLTSSLENGTIAPGMCADSYRFLLELMYMPDIVVKIRRLHELPSITETLITGVVHELFYQVTGISERSQALEAQLVTSFSKGGHVKDMEDRGSPLGTSYNFEDYAAAVYFATAAMINIHVARVLQQLNAFLEIDNPALEDRCLEWSSRIWKCCRYAVKLKPLGANNFIPPILLAFESAGPVERAYLLSVLSEIDEHRGPFAKRFNEQTIIANCKALTGRLPFLKTQDVGVEVRGEGARS
ncbi:hypothetical protein BJ170DRAFT_598794 [Xylariales sp. AK1849]|nr:hypothetical protein BJ170DRAFT_598794 [Xylariales sp. AK1849]